MKRFWSVVILVFALASLILSNACYKKLGVTTLPGIKNPAAAVSGEGGAPLEVGFAKEVITPEGSVYMGGFGQMRKSRGVHDDLYARALVLRQGKEKLAMVAIDCVGIQRTDILKLKAGVPGFRPDQILIASTHTHSGPDTIGFWGLPPLFSGMDEKYMQRLGKAVADIIKKADAAAVPASSFVAVYQADPSIMFNANEGEPEDHNLGLIVFKDLKGGSIATLWNLAGHAETMWGDNHLITADFPGRVNELIEKESGAGTIFFNADLGRVGAGCSRP